MKKIPIRSNEDEDDSREEIQETQPTPEEKTPRRIEVHEPDNSTDKKKGDVDSEDTSPASRAIEIKISFPSLRNIGRKLRPVPKKVVFAILGFAILLGAGYFALDAYELLPWQSAVDTEESALQNLTQNPEDLPRGNPTFQTITPNGQTLDEDAWVRISPEGNDPVYAYTDAVGDVEIAVSQQPLPDNFKDNVQKSMNDLAIDFGATEKIAVDSTTVYIGTSGNGPQSILFSKSNLLVLIKSADKVSTNNWARYVRSLQ